jgi:hypothetical protein
MECDPDAPKSTQQREKMTNELHEVVTSVNTMLAGSRISNLDEAEDASSPNTRAAPLSTLAKQLGEFWSSHGRRILTRQEGN